MKWLDLPPVWLVGSMAAMWALAEVAPWPGLDGFLWVGRTLIAAAVGVMIWAAIWFRRRRTTIVPHQNPEALVTEGPFRFSRNPIYAADALILVGWGLSLGAALPFVVIPAFMWIIERRFILPEEARLERAFGDAFVAWRGRVRRWI